MDEREEGETRADVARRVREQERAAEPAGPTSYEIGSAPTRTPTGASTRSPTMTERTGAPR